MPPLDRPPQPLPATERAAPALHLLQRWAPTAERGGAAAATPAPRWPALAWLVGMRAR